MLVVSLVLLRLLQIIAVEITCWLTKCQELLICPQFKKVELVYIYICMQLKCGCQLSRHLWSCSWYQYETHLLFFSIQNDCQLAVNVRVECSVVHDNVISIIMLILPQMEHTVCLLLLSMKYLHKVYKEWASEASPTPCL